MRTEVRVVGDQAVVSALTALAADVADPARGLDVIAEEGARYAAAATKRRSGRLAAGWYIERTRARAALVNAVEYAGPVNYGWPLRNITPAPVNERVDALLEPRGLQALEDDIATSIRKRGLA